MDKSSNKSSIINKEKEDSGGEFRQKESEEKIRLSEKRFEGLIQDGIEMIAIINPDGTFQYTSPSYKTILGLEPGELLRKNAFDLIHPDDRELIKKEYSKLESEKKIQLSLYRIRSKDGDYIWMQSTGRDMTNDPAIEGIVVNTMDITERKNEEQHLKLLKSVVTNSSDAVLIMESGTSDETGLRIVYVNEAFTAMTGFRADEVIGKNPRIMQGANTDPEKTARLKKALRNNEPCEIETINYKKNGEEFWNIFTISPVADEQGNYTHWVAIERDVTARKNREMHQQLLSDISQIFNEPTSLVETLGNVLKRIYTFADLEFAEVWLIDNDDRHIQLSATYFESDGMRQFYKERRIMKSFKKGKGLPGVTWEEGEMQFWRNIDKRKTFLRNKAAGKAGLKTAYGFPLIHNRQILGVLVFGKKEDLRKEHFYTALIKDLGLNLGAEIRRKKLEEELNRIFSSAPDGIIVAGFDGYLKKVNPSFCEILGYSEEEILTTPFIEFVYPGDRERTIQEYERANGSDDRSYFENRYVKKSGKIVWLSWTFKVFTEEEVTCSVAKDITEQKEIEKLLDQANRLAKIGSWELDLSNNELFWADITREIHEEKPGYKPTLEAAINYYKEGEPRELIQQAVEQMRKHGTSWDLELPIITGKGNERWIRIIGDVELVNGKPVRIYGSFQDIHEKKELEKLLDQASRLAKIGSWEIGFDKNSVYWSEITKSIYGVPDDFEPSIEKGIEFYKVGEHREEMWKDMAVKYGLNRRKERVQQSFLQ